MCVFVFFFFVFVFFFFNDTATTEIYTLSLHDALPISAENRPRTNAEADGQLLEEIAAPDAQGLQLLTQAAEALKLSARGYHRVLRVARTLADLEGGESVRRPHIAEALTYRRTLPGR